MIEENVEHFADSRNTSIEVAEAIFYIAEDNADAIRIWNEPTKKEVKTIVDLVTNKGLHDINDFQWGVDSLKIVAENNIV